MTAIEHDVYSFSPAKTFELDLYSGVPSHLLREGQLEGEIGPRLLAMVRALEGAMGIV